MNGIDEPDDLTLTDLAVRAVLATLRSTDAQRIGAAHWWPRAKAALLGAASVAEAWPHFVGRMCAKLEIEVLTPASAAILTEIGEVMMDATWFARFRAVCERDALYIVALAQAERAIQRGVHHVA